MAKFRLAVINTQPPHLYYGGVERRITETAKRLQTKADITVYSGTKRGFKTPAIIAGTTLVPLNSTDRFFPLDNWSFNRSLTKNAVNLNAEVFEAHAVSGYGLPKKLRQLNIKKPFIHTIHGVLADEHEQAKNGGANSLRDRVANALMGRQAKLERQMSKDATLIVTISNYSLQKMQKHYDVDTAKVRIVPNGVDTEKFKPQNDVATAKRQFGLGDEPCVLFVGSLIPRKGLPFLVEAAKKIVKSHADAKFVLVGDGPLRVPLQNSLAEAKLSGNFMFLNQVGEDALPAVYNCADVFVLPSIQEGQGIVLLEAQASAKPVVAFDIGGVDEAVRSGETGLLVQRGDAGELAEALLKLLDDRALRVKMGSEGRRFIQEMFTWDICAQGMLRVYHEALAT
ncbi:MAG: glycosyltransferase family 4 protein [Candidatus Bathyarchaeia archaeon]|jgi:glycosyltransferase involved in cell wall biosynthesis